MKSIFKSTEFKIMIFFHTQESCHDTLIIFLILKQVVPQEITLVDCHIKKKKKICNLS